MRRLRRERMRATAGSAASEKRRVSTCSPAASRSSCYSSSALKNILVAGFWRQWRSFLGRLLRYCVAALVPRCVAAAPLLKTHITARSASDNGRAAALASVTRVTHPVPHLTFAATTRKGKLQLMNATIPNPLPAS